MHHSSIPSRSRFALPRLLAPRELRTYTPEEVRRRLRLNDTSHERTAAVHQAAARTSTWTAALPDEIARDLGRASDRLPTVVFWYSRGMSVEEIGRRLSPFSGAWDAERALEVAASLIAHLLNQSEAAQVTARAH